MRYRKLDANGDYVIGTGSDFYVDQPEAVAQAVLTRLSLWTGDWFLDSTEGTPYRGDVMGKYNQISHDAAIKQRILQTPGVDSILSYSSSFDGNTRALSVSATIDTIYGQATISEIL